MSAPKLTVREVVALLIRAQAHVFNGCKLSEEIDAVAARWVAEVEAEEHEEHRRALEDAERNLEEPW